MATQLTEHFSLEELIRSDMARLRGIANTPRAEHLANMRNILAPFLEQVRDLIGGRPIFVESGYRNPEVNALVGGTPTSDHAQGLAADLQVAGMSDIDLAIAIRDSDLQFDQLILERGRTVHIGLGRAMRREVKSQPGGPGTQLYDGLLA